jgi:glycosyltransferase involved in cell wall biosynthesis
LLLLGLAAHRAQIRGEASFLQTQIIFSGQFLEYCRQRSIETLVLPYNRNNLRDGILHLENQPRRFESAKGFCYHVSRISYALYLAIRARRFGADLAIIDSGSAHYFALAFFRMLGIPVVINFHNILWPKGFEPRGRLTRLLRWFDGWFFRLAAAATAGIPPECGIQVRELAGWALPFYEYRSQYRDGEFSHDRHNPDWRPFRVAFVGRAERSKGVLDIADIAHRIRESSAIPIIFEVCGDGSALPELVRAVAERGLEDVVRIHDRLPQSDLLQLYKRAHAVIVPTRGDFCEGLPAVCAEAVLADMPIITSRLTNALPVLGPALVEVEPESVESYAGAIIKLAKDRTAYDRLCNACPKLATQFLDRSQSYPAAIDRLIGHLFPDWKLLSDYEPLFARLTVAG